MGKKNDAAAVVKPPDGSKSVASTRNGPETITLSNGVQV